MPERVRVAMIGAGGMANCVHYPSLASFDDVEIAAICELNADRLAGDSGQVRRQGRYLARNFDDYRQMIADVDPDAVYVIGQPHIMYPLWKWCLEHGRNLYIEKPMGLSAHQARSLAHLAKRTAASRRSVSSGAPARWSSSCGSECLERGPITHAVCEFYKCNPEPYLDARDHMMDDGVHAIDTLRWMCGGEVVDIQAISRRVGTPDINFFAVLLRFDNGATGVLLNSWTSGRRIFRVQMHAPGICVEAEHEGKGVVYADGDTKGVWYDTREVAGSDQNFVYGGFQAKNREFIDCVKTGRQPASHFADAVKTMEVADKILALDLLHGT